MLSGHFLINLLHSILCRPISLSHSLCFIPSGISPFCQCTDLLLAQNRKKKSGRLEEINKKERKASQIGHQRMEITFIECLLYAWHFTQSIYKLDKLIFISYLKDLICIFQRKKLKLSEVKKLTWSHAAKQG